jgi:hypothetical protein
MLGKISQTSWAPNGFRILTIFNNARAEIFTFLKYVGLWKRCNELPINILRRLRRWLVEYSDDYDIQNVGELKKLCDLEMRSKANDAGAPHSFAQGFWSRSLFWNSRS